MKLLSAALALLILAIPAAATAKQSSDPYGRWALRAGGETLMILELKKDKDGRIDGDLIAPAHFQLTPGVLTLSNVVGPPKRRQLSSATVTDDGLELTFRSDDEPMSFLWRPTGPLAAELTFRSFAGLTLPFARAFPEETASQDLDPEKAYVVRQEWPSNAEMKAIFDADQAARSSGSKIDWAAVTKEDEVRRERAKALLDAGELRSGLDFLRAAFIIQHGSTSNDYLLAHTLALVAMARGRPDAAWISAATLDRYLQSVGQKQIYGTQTRSSANEPPSKEPYDKEFIPAELRHALGVP